jgi:DNA primase
VQDIEKLKILNQAFGSCYNSGTELLFRCPECSHHKKKLSINIEKDVFKCWICDYSGRSIRRILRKHADFRLLSKWLKLTNTIDVNEFNDDLFGARQPKVVQRVDLPEDFSSLLRRELPRTAMHASRYLKKRGITDSDITKWKIGYCTKGKYSNRIVIPSFGLDGHCNYFVARSYNDNTRKYLNPPASRDIVFNELYVDWDKDVILVEGLFDAIIAGDNAIPLLGSSLHETSTLFKKIVDNDAAVYMALDPDAESKSLSIINKMLGYGLEVYKIDVGPYSDVGEMTREEFLMRKGKAELVGSDDYIKKIAMGI